MASVTLEIHICDQRRSYLATWEGAEDEVEQRILDFLAERGINHAWHELEDRIIDFGTVDAPRLSRLYALLYPTCEHGLDLSNCYGPQHYYYDEEEQARGMLNGAW